MTNPKIQVLLATYNGGKFLPSMLDSLLNQHSVELLLIVSDDGSTDNTLQILDSYVKYFSSIEVHNGPKNGHSANFEYLLTIRKPGIPVAFADQDDIWEPDKLKVLNQNLLTGEPCLIFSKVKVLGTTLEYPTSLNATKYSHLFQNKAMGCTQLLSPEFCLVLDTLKRPNSIDFDWWCYIVAAELGSLRSVESPLLQYRLHDNNTVGIPTTVSRILRIFRGIRQNRSFYSPQFLDGIKAQRTLSYLLPRSSGFEKFRENLKFKNFVSCIREKYFRDSYVENLYISVLVFFHWRKERRG